VSFVAETIGTTSPDSLPPVESDSLLKLIALANADPRPDKIDVGVGVFRDPPVFLTAGQTVTVEIESLGRLVNPVRAAGS